MSTSSDKDVVSERVKELLGTFTDLRRKGVQPDIAEYCRQAGQDAATLEPMLRTLVSLESLREAAGDTLSLESFRPVPPPSRIGDFQLVRIVGRGGMGVVYEAIELTLGRRVALKLLEDRRAADPRSVKRFLREAQAAARLHHTNILPVFASGEDAGIRYYAMQFVDGCTLSHVIQRARQAIESNPTIKLNAKNLSVSIEYSTPRDPRGTQPTRVSTNLAELSPDKADVDFGTEPKLPKANKSQDGKGFSYYRRVAEIGLQIAEALEHAAAQGVLHRDVKPTNIMIGTDNSVWVMDFGLATVQQAENLTESGELLGTLRYMAPERLDGHHTLQGDMYGLGMILYEMVGLRPAFDASDRSGLRRQVALATPTALRKIDSHVPVDLETIVMKCIAAFPKDRYRDMSQLILDLKLFLQDRPIASRRTSLAVQGWRWCKRNPVVAVLLNTTAVLLAALSFGSFLWAQSLRRERNAARAAEAKAAASEQLAVESSLASRRAEQASQEALELALRTEQQRKVLLFRTLVDEVRSSFTSEMSGQSLRGLQAVKELLSIIPWSEMSTEQQRELRDAATSCLSVSDTELMSSVVSAGPITANIDVDPSLSLLATHDGSHRTHIVSLDGLTHLSSLPEIPDERVFRSYRSFSPCGRWLYERFQSNVEEPNCVRIWDWQSGTLILKLLNREAENIFCFDSLGQTLYMVQSAAIFAYQLPTGKLMRTSEPKFRNVRLAISEDGKILASVSSSQPPCLLDSETFQVLDTLPDVPQALSAVWDPMNGELLIGTNGPEVLAWNPVQRLYRRLPARNVDSVTSIHLDPAGQTLSLRGHGYSEIINRQQKAQSLGVAGDVVRVSADGQRFAIHHNSRMELHRLVPSKCIAETPHRFHFAKFSPDSRWLAASGADGVRILDSQLLTTVADLGLDICGPVAWSPDGKEIATFGMFSHLSRWNVTPTKDRALSIETTGPSGSIIQNQTSIGPPRPVQLDPRRARMGLDSRIPQHQGRFSVWHPNGRSLYFVDYRHQVVYQMDAQTGECEKLIQINNPVSLAISPDGSLLAIGRIFMSRVTLFDLVNRREIKELPHLSQPTFSSDGRFLLGSRFEEIQAYATSDWQMVHRWQAESFHRSTPIPVACSPLNNLMAAAVSDSIVRLFDTQTGADLADLNFQRSDPILWLEFDDQCKRLAVVRESSLIVWDLAHLANDLHQLGIDAPFLPNAHFDGECTAGSNTSSAWTVDRGVDLLDSDRWWTGYQLLAIFEAMSMNYPDAVDNMSKALACIGNENQAYRAEALALRANFHLKNHNAHQAVTDLRMAHRLQPGDSKVTRRLGQLLLEGPLEIRNAQEGEFLLNQLEEAD